LEVYRSKICEIEASAEVRFKEMGNITEIMHQQHRNKTCYVKNIDQDHYQDLRSGEIKEKNHIENRQQDLNSVRSSLSRLRDLINTNVTDVSKCKWLTLTYKENMQDTKRLYIDFKNFIKRVRYKLGKFEYIVCMEPQERGAWHCHTIMIFPNQVGFIDNKIFADLWSFGYTKTKKLDDIDNVGAYLTAYLGDMELTRDNKDLVFKDKSNLKSVKSEGKTKKIIKGARLSFYPPKFNLYRCSRGCKKPEINYIKEFEAQKKVRGATLTYQNALEIRDDQTGFRNIISYRYYNTSKSKNKE